MFVGKWTIRESRPGEIEDSAFDSEWEAREYAAERLRAIDAPTLGRITVINPQAEELILNKNPFQRKRRWAISV
jgi:hypothetical protein